MKQFRRVGRFATAALGVLVGAALILSVPSSSASTGLQEAPDDEVDEVVTIKAVGSSLQYETTEIELEAGTTVTIRLDNSESTMPHNIVLLEGREDIQPVGVAGVQAQQTDYIPESESDRIIEYTALAKPGDVVEMTFEVPPPGEYPYICTYPGHFQTMRGTLVSVESE